MASSSTYIKPLDVAKFSKVLRSRAVDVQGKKLLIARLSGSEQEKDLMSPVNCGGYGRIRHFKLDSSGPDWSPDPLPILPAAKALGYRPGTVLRVQVFQNAACNYRCWYCFVDFDRLSANKSVSAFLSADELIDLFLKEDNRPNVIDLSGGQPDLVPEWVLWTMETLERKGFAGKIFLWSDDNLSSRYFWDCLSREQRNYIVKFPKYSRVCCFKGYDPRSFSFNTRVKPELFQEQFSIFRSLLEEGMDLYAYATFTAIPHANPLRAVGDFVDRLQKVHRNLPLRLVPLKIGVFSPMESRLDEEHYRAIEFQKEVHCYWVEELNKRFSLNERATPICDVDIKLT